MNQNKRITVREFLEAIYSLDETIYEIQITNRFKKSLDLSYRRPASSRSNRRMFTPSDADRKQPKMTI